LTAGSPASYRIERRRRRFRRRREGNIRVRHLAIASTLSLAALVSAAPSALAQEAQAMKYCKADFERLCPGVQPGGGRIIACLKEHKEEVSIGCGKALQAMKAKMGK
jgi:Cysteine rich repeat